MSSMCVGKSLVWSGGTCADMGTGITNGKWSPRMNRNLKINFTNCKIKVLIKCVNF